MVSMILVYFFFICFFFLTDLFFFFFQAEDGIRDTSVTGVQTCALPIYERLVEALELERAADIETAYFGPRTALGIERLWVDDLDAARTHLEHDERLARSHGDSVALEGLLFRLTEVEWRAGRWAEASRRAQEALDLDEQNDNVERFSLLYTHSLVDAYLGAVESAQREAEEGLVLALQGENRLF